MQDPTRILTQYWGYPTLRGIQEQVIHAVLEGRDVFALMPTGSGKSICFQVPALMRSGLCLVITPLIALMNDQVQHLNSKGIAAAALHSGLSRQETHQLYEDLPTEQYTFLYVSPERLASDQFLDTIASIEVQLMVVDEAHCIAQWGYDFRPAYLEIGALRKRIPETPVIALSASATQEVQSDIIDKLALKEPALFQQDFHRANLGYQVEFGTDKQELLLQLLKNYKDAGSSGSVLIYTRSRKAAEGIAALLQTQEYRADYYHAGLSQEQRRDKQAEWMIAKIKILVCTNAFGMGIDKPDVRLVIHYGPPDQLENYYQEAGRAGRDGAPAKAVLLYGSYDLDELRRLPALRYPEFSVIQQLYQHLADYLQIPVGLGKERFFEFQLSDFAERFKWRPLQVHGVLKALEQAGLISYFEQVFLPAKVKLHISRSQLAVFTATFPRWEPIADYLMRNYENIFLEQVTIKESKIAWALYLSQEEVKRGLSFMASQGIIRYLPSRHSPQLYFMTGRAPAAFLIFNHVHYQRQKALFIERIENMIRYLQADGCRSQIIATYFGQPLSADCGNCDNCLAKNK